MQRQSRKQDIHHLNPKTSLQSNCVVLSSFSDLIPALKQMYETKMYKRMVFYLEACESGSMFDGLLPNSWNIYATTAANPSESSWGTYCPPNDFVNGVEINSCLGDLYSVNWMVRGTIILAVLFPGIGDEFVRFIAPSHSSSLLFSVCFQENSDSVGPSETLEAQFLLVQNETSQSHVMQYVHT